MASMREMAKKNLEKMVKGAAREVNTSRPGRSGASAAPAAAKKPAAEAPAKSAAAPEASAPAKAGATKEAATLEKAGAAAEGATAAKAGATREAATLEKAGAATEAAAPAMAGAATEAAAPAKADATTEAAASAKAGAATEAAAPVKAGAASETAASSEKSADAAKISASSNVSAADIEVSPGKTASATASSQKSAGAADARAPDIEAISGKSGPATASSQKSAGAAKVSTSSDVSAAQAFSAKAAPSSGKNLSAADVASSSAKTPGVPASVFEQLQAQIQKNGKTIQKVPVESIKLNENIREAYNDEHLKTLADSMQKDGLIQFPTLCLKAGANGEFTFVCKNGHRRILAARSLGWKTIECVILPFASTRDELYHTIAANLREDVFYLDLSQAYQQANHLGESDQAIAERVGVNPRTVGWYRRLTTMAPECQALCRQYPDLFHATWAIQLARKGELPPLAVLMKQMQFMLARYQALRNNADQAAQPDRLPKTIDVEQQREAKASLKSLFSGARGSTEAQQAWQLVEQLCIAGYFKPALLNRMRRQLLSGAQKGSRRASAAES